MENNELVVIDENDELVESVGDKIITFELQIKTLKELEQEFKDKLLEEMEKRGIKTIKYKNMTISVSRATVRESFDSKKFRENNPDDYDKYVKLSDVASSLKIKVN